MEKGTRSSTADAVLAILNLHGSMTGYQIRKFMEQSTANFWSESFGQIYPALKRLLADGLIEEREISKEGHPSKKAYAVTEQGEERFNEWLAAPARPSVPRNEFLLKLFFGGLALPDEMRVQIQAYREVAQADLLRLEPMEKELKAKYGERPGHYEYPPLPYWLMTLRYGVASAKMTIKWCDETLEQLKKLDDAYNKRSGNAY
jgi:DNA-binding PadR family transcriptional regulator